MLIAWRRPKTTAHVMTAIRAVRPAQLFIAVDGPDEEQRPGEAAKVSATIKTIEQQIDWPCHVERRYSTTNLGCRVGVTGAIDWFFEHVDEGIILEDDCVPHPEFFPYCAELLERFRDSPQVMCISGDNSAAVTPKGSPSYSFIRYPQIWGWATWRRAWNAYDRDLLRYQQARADGTWNKLVPDTLERKTFERVLNRMVERGEPDSWAYPWAATLLLEKGLSVHPAVNLISNVGFGENATHTTASSHPRADAAVAPILPLRHRSVIRLERATSRQVFLATQVSWKKAAQSRGLATRARRIPSAVRRRALRLLGYEG